MHEAIQTFVMQTVANPVMSDSIRIAAVLVVVAGPIICKLIDPFLFSEKFSLPS